MKKIIFSLLILALVFISACTTQENDTVVITDFNSCIQAGNSIMESYPRQCIANGETFIEELSLKEVCENLNQGNWIESAKECEFISEEICEDMNGEYNECGSACRNDPNTEICTLQCVPFCSFNEENNSNKSSNLTQEHTQIKDSYGNIVPNTCSSWFDGCNNCMVGENGLLACTLMFCENPSEPKCNEPTEDTQIKDSYGNIVPNTCNSWFDGCNNCMVGENGLLACTKMFCENLSEPKCNN